MTSQTPSHPATGKTVPLWRTLLYSLGNAAGLLTYTTFNAFIQYFYTDVKGLPPNWVGRGWFAFGLWNAVNDPLAGWVSDRTSTRWGRRRFYIGFLAIPTAVAFAAIWLPPLDASNPSALMVYFLVIISIYDLLQSIVTLNQDALFPEMYQDTGDRAKGASTRQLIGFVVGNGMAVALTPTIYGKLGWNALAVLWGTLAAVMYFLSLLGIRENPAFAKQKRQPWRAQMRVVLGNRTFLIVLCINFMTRFIIAAIVAIMPFYADYVLRISEEQLTQLLLALFATSGGSVLLWQIAIRRLGTRQGMMLSMGVAALFALPLLLTSSLAATALVLALLGLSIGGVVLGPDMLFAEVVDEDYVKTGVRREGTYRGLLGFIYRFPPAVAGLLLGEGLTLAGYDSALGTTGQPEAVITMIRGFAAFLPLIALVLGIALLVKYPLHGEYLRMIQRQAMAMREQTERSATYPASAIPDVAVGSD
ncbi:MAG: MFS transporter [Aggregatilineaceae bacterium]